MSDTLADFRSEPKDADTTEFHCGRRLAAVCRRYHDGYGEAYYTIDARTGEYDAPHRSLCRAMEVAADSGEPS